MKKGLIFAALALVVVTFRSCIKSTRSTVSVTVEDVLGVKQTEKVVYMFTLKVWDEKASNPLPADAKKKVVTDRDGVAVFELSSLDLEFVDSQTTVYFAVFADDAKTILGAKPITIKSGDHRTLTITMLAL